ncbi:hypothetical protein PMI16_01179 [Herbaspirillum sp. CF444]|uniref:hypothetical protein n=1 Tax=Herbaspirillum sp. CF444 TaxID=1144319 RepID=UPI0002722D31|nr:hypothetical protein [Herbaspirillum sp. CF444]EJL92238.1 hypothetical protein PMI16_01179 [Herbaspirillum sp. CF444]
MDVITFLGMPAVLSTLIVLLAFLFACVFGMWFGMFLSTYAPELVKGEQGGNESDVKVLEH